MRATFQQTLSRAVEFNGIGLHSGQECVAAAHPAGVDAGIVFRRLDLEEGVNTVAASPRNVRSTRQGTTLASANGASVATVEHLMAALCLAGVDNVRIDLFGPEIPILDGSALGFFNAFNEAGYDLQSAPRRGPVALAAPLAVRDGDRSIEIEPGDGRILDIAIDFEDCMIGRQSLRLDLDNPGDRARLIEARTFCRIEEIDCLRAAGLARGGSLENSLVVDGARVLNKTGLRDNQEFALHKALDLIGDLYLLGAPVEGVIRAVKPGHDLNVRMARALLAENARFSDRAAARASEASVAALA